MNPPNNTGVAFKDSWSLQSQWGLRTILRAEKLRIGSSAARETELSMMKTRMRLVKIWWLISLWQNTRILRQKITQRRRDYDGKKKKRYSWFLFLSTDIVQQHVWDSRVGAAEDEEGAAHWDGLNLLFDGEFRQPLRTGSWRDFWAVFVIVFIITH